MAGSLSLSLSQQLDQYGKPLDGGLLYFIRAGTTATPQSAYQDTALAIPWPNPIVLDAAGRVPAFYLADGQIKVRLTDKFGVQQFVQDNLLVIGPSAGGGGGGGVDPTALIQTGNLIFRYGVGALAGYVRLNARTIGNATSGASERANADCQALFEFLWNTDSTLAVTPSRGSDAHSDWLANKQLQLPDGRSRLLMALADMGNVASTLMNGVTFGGSGNSTTLGSYGGACRATLGTPNLPPYTPSFSSFSASGNFAGGNFNGNGNVSGTATGTGTGSASTGQGQQMAAAASGIFAPTYSGGGALPNNMPVNTNDTINNWSGTAVSVSTNVSGPVSVSVSYSFNAQGGTSTPFDLTTPFLLVSVYIKL